MTQPRYFVFLEDRGRFRGRHRALSVRYWVPESDVIRRFGDYREAQSFAKQLNEKPKLETELKLEFV